MRFLTKILPMQKIVSKYIMKLFFYIAGKYDYKPIDLKLVIQISQENRELRFLPLKGQEYLDELSHDEIEKALTK
jgi:hypothetical protein